MALKRDSLPPPRPPAPKSLTRRSASNNSIKKSFKLLEEDEEDEEDLTVLTGEFDKKLDKSKVDVISKGDKSKESTPVKTAGSTPQSESKTLGLNQRSRSLDDDKSSSNVSRIKQNFVDISSGLKDKLAKKWEEISAEMNSPVDGNTDQKTEEMMNQNADISRIDVKRLEIAMSENGEENLIIETAKNSNMNKPIKDETDKKVLVRSQRLPPTPEEMPVDDTDIHLVDNFYTTEPSDAPTETNLQSNELRQRNKSGLKKILKNKGSKTSNSPTGTPVSMSKLMTKTDNEEQESEEQGANTEFFDASDMDLTSNNSLQSDASSGNDQKLNIPTGHVKMSDLTAVPVRKLTAGSIFIFFYWILPLPSYISGMLMGLFLASAGWAVYLWLNKPPTQKCPIEKIPVNKLPPMVVPEMKDVVTEDGIYKGWMNEIPSYNPEKYHINQTHSIFVDLENTTLRLRRPRTNIAKRSMWDEPPIHLPQFIHQRHYNIEGSKVFLVPPGLVKKRIWSKKYPICITLASVDPKHHPMANEQKLAETPDSESGFEIVTEQTCGNGILFLFARTCREKEDWYKRFTAAAAGKPLPSHLGLIRKCINKTKSPCQHQSRDNNAENGVQHKRQSSTDSTSSGSSSPTKEQEDVPVTNQTSMEDFIRFMGRVMPKEVKDSQSSPTHMKKGAPEYVSPIDCDFSILWLNALINRIFWDFLHEQYFIDKVLDKLQRKLSKIHIPYFIEELKITNIDLGNEVPSLRRGARPYFDEQGFWVDVDVNYEGGFQMTIETKVNLMRLKKTTTTDKQEEGTAKKSAITDEDEEDSAESSSDEEEDATSPSADEGARGGKASRKIMGYLGKITQSKYFQSATEIKYIKKKMEEVSNTPIELTVEVRILSGTMTINIPPPPTDRLWYGFRGSPKLQLVAKPKVGARELTLTHITEWIEKKLSTEFQRTFVYPNLDDLEVPTFTTYTPNGVEPPTHSGSL